MQANENFMLRQLKCGLQSLLQKGDNYRLYLKEFIQRNKTNIRSQQPFICMTNNINKLQNIIINKVFIINLAIQLKINISVTMKYQINIKSLENLMANNKDKSIFVSFLSIRVLLLKMRQIKQAIKFYEQALELTHLIFEDILEKVLCKFIEQELLMGIYINFPNIFERMTQNHYYEVDLHIYKGIAFGNLGQLQEELKVYLEIEICHFLYFIRMIFRQNNKIQLEIKLINFYVQSYARSISLLIIIKFFLNLESLKTRYNYSFNKFTRVDINKSLTFDYQKSQIQLSTLLQIEQFIFQNIFYKIFFFKRIYSSQLCIDKNFKIYGRSIQIAHNNSQIQ
ncbi:hypothetical protein pb186bvf_020537 [Paramecium bursaria]